MHLRPWPQVWEYRDWIAHLKTELARMVAPYGRQVMKWLADVFQLEDSAIPVPDEALQQSGESPKPDVALAQGLMKCAE